MAAIDFPNSPTVGQSFTAAGKTWKWTGSYWDMVVPATGSSPVDLLPWKRSVEAATTTNITLSGVQTIDGVPVVVGNRVLVKNQTNGAENGIYVVASGAWTRALDADTAQKMEHVTVQVHMGAVNADWCWMCTTTPPFTLGVTSLAFRELNRIQAGGWTDFTPTIAQGTATDIAKTVSYSRWTRWGRTIHFNFQLNVTGAGAASHVTVSLPVSLPSAATHALGAGSISDASASGVNSAGFWYPTTVSTVGLVAHGATNAFGISPATVLASGDTIYGSLAYEAAS